MHELNTLSKFLMEEVEMPITEVVAQMEENGHPVDEQFFRDLRSRIEPEIDTVVKSIHVHAEKLGMADFSPGSPKQTTELLYDRLKLKCHKRTKKGAPSTDGETLEKLQSGVPQEKWTQG